MKHPSYVMAGNILKDVWDDRASGPLKAYRDLLAIWLGFESMYVEFVFVMCQRLVSNACPEAFSFEMPENGKGARLFF